MKTLSFTMICSSALLLLVAVASPVKVQAHGAGMTFSATSTIEGGKPYIIDVDYTDTAIIADSFGRFDFNLFADAERTTPVEFTDLWVRIEQDNGSERGKTIFAGPIAKQEIGGQGFALSFPKGGRYVMNVTYNDSNLGRWGETVAEAEFPFDVLRADEKNGFNFSIEFWVGLISGLFLAATGSLPLLMRKS